MASIPKSALNINPPSLPLCSERHRQCRLISDIAFRWRIRSLFLLAISAEDFELPRDESAPDVSWLCELGFRAEYNAAQSSSRKTVYKYKYSAPKRKGYFARSQLRSRLVTNWLRIKKMKMKCVMLWRLLHVSL